MTESNELPTVEARPARGGALRRRMSIGFPAASGGERRFPLTPEAAEALVGQGYEILVEAGAGAPIRYADAAYASAGATVAPRAEALRADMVASLAPLGAADVRAMRRGAMLLTLLRSVAGDPAVAGELLRRNVVAIALDRVGDDASHAPFADVLSEVDGRAAIVLAAALLAAPERGRGMLLGGVAGVNPCEVLIVGAGIAGRAAAASALGLGAAVRVVDDDVYRLRRVAEATAGAALTATLRQRVVEHALTAADVVVAAPMRKPFALSAEQVALMKRGVIVVDLRGDDPLCPSLPAVDAGAAALAMPAGRVCVAGVGNVAARTAAMALSDALLTLLRDMTGCDGAVNIVRMLPGVQRAVLTFLGKPVNQRVAAAVGMRPIDISLLLGCG